jgi:hypothetical protein
MSCNDWAWFAFFGRCDLESEDTVMVRISGIANLLVLSVFLFCSSGLMGIAQEKKEGRSIKPDLTKIPDGTIFYFDKASSRQNAVTYVTDHRVPRKCAVSASTVAEKLSREEIYSVANLADRFRDWEELISENQQMSAVPLKISDTSEVDVCVTKARKGNPHRNDYDVTFMLIQGTAVIKIRETWTLEKEQWVLQHSEVAGARW